MCWPEEGGVCWCWCDCEECCRYQTTDSIRIVLEITDGDTLEAYGDVNPSFIEDDLRSGTLMKMCNVVSIKQKTGAGHEDSIPLLESEPAKKALEGIRLINDGQKKTNGSKLRFQR